MGGIQSPAVPPLGCGNGQLLWENVKPTIYKYLNTIDIPVKVYAPYGTPKEQLQTEFLANYTKPNNKIQHQKIRKLNPTWLPLVEILYELEKHPYKTQS